MSIEVIQKLLDLTEHIMIEMKRDEFLKKDERSAAILETAQKNLREKRYVVSVIAAMKAGKSTTFNALLGRDLLPNETDACTAAITEIRHSLAPSEKVKKVLADGSLELIVADHQGTLEENFHRDVRSSRKENKVRSIKKYQLDSPILALESSPYKDLVQNFILVDTPGPNEALIGESEVAHLQALAFEQLKQADALIMLFDFQTFKSDTNAIILKAIFENRKALEKDKDKVYFLINKIDAMRERDGTVEEIIDKVKHLIREYAPVITNPQVYALSGKQACLARTVLNNRTTPELYSEMERHYGSQYSYQKLIDGESFTVIPKPEQFARQLLEDSNILQIEQTIIENMFIQSSKLLVENGFERLSQVIQNIINAVQIQLDIANKDSDELLKSVELSKQKVEGLKSEGEVLKTIPRTQIEKLVSEMNSILNELVKNATTAVTQFMNSVPYKLEGTSRQSVEAQARSIQQAAEQAMQISLNQDIDRIQRLFTDYQVRINQELNQSFHELAIRASALIGQNIALQFQIFNMEDIASKANFTSMSIEVRENSGKNNRDSTDDLVGGLTKGAAIGLGAALFIPGLNIVAGLLAGGVLGGLIGLSSQTDQGRGVEFYSVDISEMKREILDKLQQSVNQVVRQLQSALDESRKKYVDFVEHQLNQFITNLKEQLDDILREYQSHKGSIEEHVRHMNHVRSMMKGYGDKLHGLKKTM